MKEIKIEVPTGYKVKGFNKETNTIELEKELSLLQELVYKYNINVKDLEQDEIAFKVLKKIVKEANGGWTPDWDDFYEKKHYPYFEMDSSDFHFNSVYLSSFAPASLAFKTAELCKQTVKKYLEIYKIYLGVESIK